MKTTLLVEHTSSNQENNFPTLKFIAETQKFGCFTTVTRLKVATEQITQNSNISMIILRGAYFMWMFIYFIYYY